jgi:hypothetical protein
MSASAAASRFFKIVLSYAVEVFSVVNKTTQDVGPIRDTNSEKSRFFVIRIRAFVFAGAKIAGSGARANPMSRI